MRKSDNPIGRFLFGVTAAAFIFSFPVLLHAQDRSVTSYQYRHVPDDKIQEFIKRETTYWSKVAEKAAKEHTMTFWALLEKVGGYDLPNSSNFLFINTFPDIDKVGEVFNNAAATAGVKMEDMETNSISTTTSQFFLHDVDWAQDAKAVPPQDFNYVVLIYHDTNYPDSLVGLETKYWKPFIQKSMDNDATTQMAWGNAVVLAPQGSDIKFTTVSYDLYKTLRDALMPNWKTGTVFPGTGLQMINSIETGRRGMAIYRVIKVVTSSSD